MPNTTQLQFGGTNINPYTNFLTNTFSGGALASPTLNFKPTTIPLDFTSKTLQGAMLPQKMFNVPSKLNLPKSDWLGKSATATGSSKLFSGTGTPSVGAIGNMGMDLIGSLAPQLDHVSGASKALKIGSKVAGMIPGPWGQAASLAMNGIATLDQLLGKKATQQATAGATATGYDLNFNANAGTSYGGLFGNKKRKETNKLSSVQDKSNILKMNASNMGQKEMTAATNSYGDIYSKNQARRQGGMNTNVLAASKGTKLSLAKIANKVLSKEQKQEEIKMNLIPSGALHARKNNLPNEIADQVTNKGVPVVSFEEGGDIVQHAEVEREELTLHKALTVKLEDLLSQYKDANEEEKDKILIKTGKLLTYEILENTQDNVDLINKTE